MPESFALVRLLNALLMGVEAKAFQSIGVAPAEAIQKAIKVNQALGLELLVAAGLIAFFLLVRLTLSADRPNPAQQIAEMIHETCGGLADQIIGHGYEQFQAWVTCIFLFVLINNLLGLIPGIEAPTVSPWVPLGLAVPTFLFYNYQGIRAQGLIGYLKHFCGPIWWMAWLLLPIAYYPSLCQHVCKRHGHTRLLLTHPRGSSGYFPGSTCFCFFDSSLRFHAADDDLSFAGCI